MRNGRDKQVFRFVDPNGFTTDMAQEIREAVLYSLSDDILTSATNVKITVEVKKEA